MKKIMKKILIVMVSMLFITACSTELDQVPPNQVDADNISDYEPVLVAAYSYHYDAIHTMPVLGDFRSDDCLFDETPYTDFADFSGNSITSSMNADFFKPFYSSLYQSILSANDVIINSTDATQVGEAQFVRALAYFKLVQVFGDVTVNLLGAPTVEEIAAADLTRQPKNEVYTNIIIPDLQAAKSALGASSAANAGGRATSNAAQGLLGKVYATMGNYAAAATELGAVINGAAAAGIALVPDYSMIFGSDNNWNSEILFATAQSSSAVIPGATRTEIIGNWYAGKNTKADDGAPLSADLIAAFAASAGDLRTALTLNGETASVKYDSGSYTDMNWIELRLTDVIMLYAEALNETTNSGGGESASILALLDPIRTRAGLGSLSGTASTQAEVRQAILDERRLEFACEGLRWFDLVRFDAASPGILDAEMGKTINSSYHVFPVPVTEVTSFDEIIQNEGY
ncbi:RagB/SusD family nutrient uptake outer membrane protein [Kriegella aquimaris]|nr:RagB/SusD family nutrient uptake outer membrane protein [Kriegella aquimaris]